MSEQTDRETRMMIDPPPTDWRPYAVDQLHRAERAESDLRALREKVARVEALHVKVDHAWEDKHWCEADGRTWPCQTIAALSDPTTPDQ